MRSILQRAFVQGALVAALLFACYAATAAPGVWYGDSAELAAAAHGLGVAHPPGYSLYLLAGRLAMLGGADAFGLNLLSALLAALSVGMFHVLLLRCTGSAAAALFGALAAGVSPLFWGLATVAEVYPLALALLLAALLAATLLPGRRGIFLAAYAAGTAAAHHPMGLFYLFPLALFLYARGSRIRGARDTAIAALLFLLPWTAHFYLMIRAGSDAMIRWGHAGDFAGLVRHVARLDYGDLLLGTPGGEGLGLLARLAVPWRYLAHDFGATLPLLALLGAAVVLRRRRTWEIAALAAALIFGGVLLPALLEVKGTPASIAGNRIFFLPLAFLACGLAAAGLARLARFGGVLRWIALPFVLILALPLVRGLADQNRRHDRGAGDLARLALRDLEPNATLRIAEGQLLFPVVYMQTVEGVRPDVRIEAPRSVVHATSPGGGPVYFSTDEGIPPSIPLAPWSFLFRRVGEGEQVDWKPEWDDLALRTRPAAFMAPMEREVVYGFHLRYARNLAGAGRVEAAARELRRAEVYADEAAQGWLHMTRAYRDVGMAEDAVRCARRAVEKDPRDWRAQLFAGMALVEAENFPAAENYFREAARLEPANGVGDLYLADLMLRLGRVDDAVEPARRGLARNPNHPLAGQIREALGTKLQR